MAPRHFIRCKGDETKLVDCEFDGFLPPHDCDEARLVCLLEAEPGTEGEVRLVDRVIDNERKLVTGTLQIFHNASWGRLCIESYRRKMAAPVACRQLGYHDQGKAIETRDGSV